MLQQQRNLNGAKILVTRPDNQADGLCKLIERQNGVAIRFPTVQIRPAGDVDKIRFTLGHLDVYDWVFFVSSNAVNFALQAKSGRIVYEGDARFAAIGQATAKTMFREGMSVDLVPEKGYSSEVLLAMPELQAVQGLNCLIVRGQGGRELLAQTLRKRGATVTYLEVYKRTLPDCDRGFVIDKIKKNLLDVITVTSCQILQNLVCLVGEEAKSELLSIPLVVLSERIEHLALKIGFTKTRVAAKPADEEIIKTVIALINGE